MNRIGNESGRAYRSELRAEQATQTRGRILDATMRVMAQGAAGVSVPAVAREAGVSVPTIYRHFGTKRDLIAAVYPHLVARAGLDRAVFPRSVDELRPVVRAYFERFDTLDDVARAVMASPAAEDARRLSMPKRVAMTRRFADVIDPKPSAEDRGRIARLLVVLTSSSAVRMWRDHLGSSAEQAADDIDWVIRAAIAAGTE